MQMTRKEFDEAVDGQHVSLVCEDHPTKSWSCKKIALSEDGGGKFRYNGRRNLFFVGDSSDPEAGECECPSSKLYANFKDE